MTLIDKESISVTKVASVVLGVVAGVAWVYNTIIIPIDSIQTQLVTINQQITSENTQYEQVIANQQSFEQRLTAIENKIH